MVIMMKDYSIFTLNELENRKNELEDLLDKKKATFVFDPMILDLITEKTEIEFEINKRNRNKK